MIVGGQGDLAWWVPGGLLLATVVAWAVAWWLTGRHEADGGGSGRLRRVARAVLLAIAVVFLALFFYTVFAPTVLS